MRRNDRNQGFTVIELLVTASILVVVLGILGAFLVQQIQLNRTTQARNEVQDKVRQVAEVVAQDLHMAGASRYVDEDGDSSAGVILASCSFPEVKCLLGEDGGLQDAVEVAYVTSLRDATAACSNVRYEVRDGALQRSEQVCDPIEPTPGNSPSERHADADYEPFADNIVAFDVQYVCSNGAVVDNYPESSSCGADTYPRTARFTVVGASSVGVPGRGQEEYQTVSGQTVACPEDRVCFAQHREVIMPNLKDR